MNNRFPFLLTTILVLFTFSVMAEQQTTTPTTQHNSAVLAINPLQTTMNPELMTPPPTCSDYMPDAEPIPECYIINREVQP